MEEVDGEHLVFVVEAEDVGVFVIGRGDALLILHLRQGDQLIAEAGGQLELHLFGGGGHALVQQLFQLFGAAFEEELDVADGLAVDVMGDQAFDAGAQAALDVVLQAGARVVAVEVHLARRDEEAAVDEVDQPIGQVAGKERAKIGAAVLAQAAGDEDLRMPVVAASA